MRNCFVFCCVTILIICLFTFVGCDNESSNTTVTNESNNTETTSSNEVSDTESNFIAVASIEYNANKDASASYPHTNLNSTCYLWYSKSVVTASEYENATNKIDWLTNSLVIGQNGKASNGLSVEELNSLKGKTFYYKERSGDFFDSTYSYYEVTFSDVIISLLQVDFFEDGSFLVKRLDSRGATITTRIKPVYYLISYFNE